MRLDKYLKLTRLIKRRTISKELILKEKFLVNNKPSKPSTNVKIGDTIELFLGNHHLVIVVNDIKDYVLKNDSTSLYKVVKDEIIKETKEE